MLHQHPLTKQYDLSSVRYCVVAGAPMSGELAGQLIQVFPGVQLGQGWGKYISKIIVANRAAP